MKGIYLAAYKARHEKYNIDYNDVLPLKGINIIDDMLNVDITKYDYIIATPPCNYWSKANYRKDTSEYALKTKHLLPEIIKKLSDQDKPFIIENVKNYKRWKENGIFELINKYPNNFIYTVGRHVYITNIMCNLICNQTYDFKSKGYNHTIRLKNNCQGGDNVHKVIEIWLLYLTQMSTKINGDSVSPPLLNQV